MFMLKHTQWNCDNCLMWLSVATWQVWVFFSILLRAVFVYVHVCVCVHVALNEGGVREAKQRQHCSADRWMQWPGLSQQHVPNRLRLYGALWGTASSTASKAADRASLSTKLHENNEHGVHPVPFTANSDDRMEHIMDSKSLSTTFVFVALYFHVLCWKLKKLIDFKWVGTLYGHNAALYTPLSLGLATQGGTWIK